MAPISQFKIWLLAMVAMLLSAALVQGLYEDLHDTLKQYKKASAPTGTAPKKASLMEKKLDSSKLLLISDKKIDEHWFDPSSRIEPKYEEFDEKNYTETLRVQEQDDKVIKINHSYFEVHYYRNPTEAMNLWIDIKSFNESQFVHEVLSNSHRRAASISLPFNFSFYGNNITRITVATGGFLYMGEHVHSWLAATQYIAPLMANFDTRNSSKAQILYGYNSTVFVIQWDNVMLQERPEYEFTFQCALHPNGDIAFVYKKIPLPIEEIPDTNHPVKVGVSDAYFINRQQIFVRRKTIYEYSKIDIIKNDQHKFKIQNNTAIFLKALPTCNYFKSCETCLTSNTSFNCVWCDSVQRCSDGYDRQRQDWIYHHCENENIQNLSQCSTTITTTPSSSSSATSNTSSHNADNSLAPSSTSNASAITPSPTVFHNRSTVINDHSETNPFYQKNLTNLEYNTQEPRIGNNPNNRHGASAHSSLAISLFLIIALMFGMFLWVMYAYHYPTTSSGQLLIRWRPSTWRWKGGETRYTAASIHM